ncbi:MAG: hypothetical protein ACAI35_18925 [Candidatus Methylacidiphilales bacterium]
MRRFHHNEQSSALVVTLLLTSLITILLIGFVGSMRMEVVSARSHYNGICAQIYAETAVNIGAARLQTGTINRTWISQPGRLLVSQIGTNQPVNISIDLSSGWLDDTSSDVTVDLNPRSQLSFGKNLIASTNTPLRVRWIYIRQNGTLETNAPPAYSSFNPVVGRFAFWTDDESAKINANTAWQRGTNHSNIDTSGHPSQVDVTGLLAQSDIDAVQAYRQIQYFNSLNELRRVNARTAKLVDDHGSSFSHYNHSPELNMFGEQRILLTTQRSVAEKIYGPGTTNFLDILAKDNADPGLSNADVMSDVKVTATVKRIGDLLMRKNWPIMPGQSFANKYAPKSYPDRIDQLALNIIDYVRSRESTNITVSPLHGESSLGNRYKYIETTGNFIGCTRHAYITEIGVYMGISNTAIYRVEIYLPPGCDRIKLTEYTFGMSSRSGLQTVTPGDYLDRPFPSTVFIKPGPPPASPISSLNGKAYLDSSNEYIEPGTYRVVTGYQQNWPARTKTCPPGRPEQLSLRVYGLAGDSAPMADNIGRTIVYNVNPTNISLANITSVAVADPLLNKHKSDWIQGPNSFGQPNANDSDHLPPLEDPNKGLPTIPPQDRDAGGAIYKNGARFTSSKGTPGNPNGLVESVAELGFVHTGIAIWASGGIPWRTLRLQPQPDSGNYLPDWAILDLFAAPVNTTTTQESLLYPVHGSIAGKINLNNTVLPFVNSVGNPAFTRPEPLAALVCNATFNLSTNPTPVISSSEAEIIMDNIIKRKLANDGRRYNLDTNSYISPWQITEVAGVADKGEESEELLRSIGSLATVRSGVFSIYSVGQAIRQDVSGSISVLGERRFQKMMEQTETGFQPVYTKELKP